MRIVCNSFTSAINFETVRTPLPFSPSTPRATKLLCFTVALHDGQMAESVDEELINEVMHWGSERRLIIIKHDTTAVGDILKEKKRPLCKTGVRNGYVEALRSLRGIARK